MKYGKYHCNSASDYVLQDYKRCYDKILSDWNFRLPSLGFKCIMVGLMKMIDGSSSSGCDGEHFVLKIHKLLLLFDFVFRKYASCNHPLKNIQTNNNNNLCILRTKCSPSQPLDDDPTKKMMAWQKELIVLALQGMKCMHVFFLFSISCLCSANSGPFR
jgi:hypothetical protein